MHTLFAMKFLKIPLHMHRSLNSILAKISITDLFSGANALTTLVINQLNMLHQCDFCYVILTWTQQDFTGLLSTSFAVTLIWLTIVKIIDEVKLEKRSPVHCRMHSKCATFLVSLALSEARRDDLSTENKMISVRQYFF